MNRNMKLSLRTPSKINLGLHILGKREDGFHELETLMQMVDLYDEMEMEDSASGIELKCDMPGIPVDETNLVMRATILLQKEFPEKSRGIRFNLSKKIPAGVGLGGGSGNAAGALMGLNVLWDLKLNRQELVPFAARLGMDIPFFLTSPAAVGRGRGEILYSVQPSKKFKVLLILPRIEIATTWAYRNLNLKLTNRENNISILQKFLSQSEIGRLGAGLFNDLEPVVIERFPVIQTVKDKLRDQNAKGVLMSGSGSSVFGLFDDPEQAKTAYASFENGDWDRSLTETIATFDEFLPEEILSYP